MLNANSGDRSQNFYMILINNEKSILRLDFFLNS
jgi:hypothetical protein